MSNQMIFGNVNANGAIFTGTDNFSVSKLGQGSYVINFKTNFLDAPALTATQNSPDFQGQGPVGNTRDNVLIHEINSTNAVVHTGGEDGQLHDRNFSFICLGVTG